MANRLIALFKYEDDLLAAAGRLKESGFDDVTVMSPIHLHGAEKVLGMGKSAVRRFSLIGALLGALGGFAMAAGTALVFILPTGGRPLVPLPPYLVITYEMTILFGVLATLLGFHIVSGLPAWEDEPYDMSTNVDRFSVVVGCGAGQDPAAAESIMKEAGADEIGPVEVES